MAVDFPRTVEEITTGWLSGVLGAPVSSFETKVLEGGALAEVFRLHSITYDGDPGDAPSSVVVKVAHRNPEQRAGALSNNAYLKELRFFEDLAPEVPLRSPRLYGSASDGSPQAEFFILVMEDLGLHSKVFDQVEDPPSAEFARKLALEAAELHAKYWESPTVALPWLGRSDGRYEFAMDASVRTAAEGWGRFRPLWQQAYGTDVFDRREDAPLEELNTLLCGPLCGAVIDRISDVLTSRPRTVLHGDLRADNIFRTDPARGKNVEESTLTYIDWQLIHAGPPGLDFAEAWLHSLEPEVRRTEREMLREYHERLVELEPAAAAYTYEMLMEDYALGGCLWWNVFMGFGPAVMETLDQPGTARMRDLMHTAVVRFKTALVDLDCLTLVKRICADLLEDEPVRAGD